METLKKKVDTWLDTCTKFHWGSTGAPLGRNIDVIVAILYELYLIF